MLAVLPRYGSRVYCNRLKLVRRPPPAALQRGRHL